MFLPTILPSLELVGRPVGVSALLEFAFSVKAFAKAGGRPGGQGGAGEKKEEAFRCFGRAVIRRDALRKMHGAENTHPVRCARKSFGRSLGSDRVPIGDRKAVG
jgi:hypothetical protein